jgi:hypothetical protein
MTDCTVMGVSKIEIQRVLKDEPTFSQMFVTHILVRNAPPAAPATPELWPRRCAKAQNNSTGRLSADFINAIDPKETFALV